MEQTKQLPGQICTKVNFVAKWKYIFEFALIKCDAWKAHTSASR